jgi:hypothetical protein
MRPVDKVPSDWKSFTVGKTRAHLAHDRYPLPLREYQHHEGAPNPCASVAPQFLEASGGGH